MNLQTEPARIAGLVVTAILAVFDVLAAFHVITDDPEARTALLSALTSMIPVVLVATEFIRSKVSSPATVKRLTSGKRR